MSASKGPIQTQSLLDQCEIETVELFGFRFNLIAGERISETIKKNGIYEVAQTRLLPCMLNIGGHYFDVGANIGYYTMWLARLGMNRSFVHSFEPNPLAHAILRKNVTENGVESCVTVNNLAVGDQRGEILTRLPVSPPKGSTDGKFNLGGWSLDNQKTGSFPVSIVTLDDYVKENKIPSVKFIKIDVQGLEDKVMLGAERVLGKMHPNLMIEFAAPDERRRKRIEFLARYLREFRYSLAKIESRPFPHMRRLQPDELDTAPFNFYIFACRAELNFLA